MIIVEESLKKLIEQIPEIQINAALSRKPSFHWGDELELGKYIKLRDGAAYPLIWLLPGEDTYISKGGARYNKVERICSFVLATRETRKELLNTERYRRSYDIVLNPLLDYLLTCLTKSNIVEQLDNEFIVLREPNYSAESEKNATIDIWDAIKFDIKLRFKDNINCLKPVFFPNYTSDSYGSENNNGNILI